ncbi:MAG: DbpA RNA binding domain-containing protein, partial [Rubrivivax sp.]|nr:DbpA RNA binding domain-containing protein [Rubrivivax sp.]
PRAPPCHTLLPATTLFRSVGAIANEAQVNARGIGDIEIADAFSLVELPEADADRVVAALRGATLRGRKVTVRRDDGRRKT